MQHRILETLQPLTKTDKPGSFERARCRPPGAIHVHSMRGSLFGDPASTRHAHTAARARWRPFGDGRPEGQVLPITSMRSRHLWDALCLVAWKSRNSFDKIPCYWKYYNGTRCCETKFEPLYSWLSLALDFASKEACQKGISRICASSWQFAR